MKSVVELKRDCRQRGIVGYSNLTRAALERRLHQHQFDSGECSDPPAVFAPPVPDARIPRQARRNAFLERVNCAASVRELERLLATSDAFLLDRLDIEYLRANVVVTKRTLRVHELLRSLRKRTSPRSR